MNPYGDRASVGSGGAPKPRSWRVLGAYAANGADAAIIVTAPDKLSAETIAQAHGIYVSSVVTYEKPPYSGGFGVALDSRATWAVVILVLAFVIPVAMLWRAQSKGYQGDVPGGPAGDRAGPAMLPPPRVATIGVPIYGEAPIVGTYPLAFGNGVYYGGVKYDVAADLPDGKSLAWAASMTNMTGRPQGYTIYAEFCDKDGEVVARAKDRKMAPVGTTVYGGIIFIPANRLAEVSFVRCRLAAYDEVAWEAMRRR